MDFDVKTVSPESRYDCGVISKKNAAIRWQDGQLLCDAGVIVCHTIDYLLELYKSNSNSN